VAIQQIGYRLSYPCPRLRLASERDAQSPHARLYRQLRRSVDQPGLPQGAFVRGAASLDQCGAFL
jgi:hypothetical protein